MRSFICSCVSAFALVCQGFNVDGLEYSQISSNTVEVSGTESLVNVVIPESATEVTWGSVYPFTERFREEHTYTVTRIANHGFQYLRQLQSVTIPHTITEIPDGAFQGCSGLRSVSYSGNCHEIGSRAFYGCSSLRQINLHDGITNIGSHAFYGCESLTSVSLPTGIREIPEYAFFGCKNLDRVLFGGACNKIGTYAFGKCEALREFWVPDSVETIGSSVFSSCTNLNYVRLPQSVTSIESGTFYDCKRLVNIDISPSVTNIGEFAFKNCISLTSFFFPAGLLSLESSAFEGCGLGRVVIPEGITRLPYKVFSDCKNLNSVVLGKTVSSVDYQAFSNCQNLKSVTIQGDIVDISFANCTNITDVTFTAAYSIGGKLRDSVTNATIISGSQKIASWAFDGWQKLSHVSIPESVSQIGDYAFRNCISLPALELSDNVTSIGSVAFGFCTNMYEVSLPKELRKIGKQAFAKVPGPFHPRCRADIEVDDSAFEKVTVPKAIIPRSTRGWHWLQNGENWHGLKVDKRRASVKITLADSKTLEIGEDWVDENSPLLERNGGDYEKAVNSKTGKIDPNGNEMFAWQDFIAGTDPCKSNDLFKAIIEINDGHVNVSWYPDLNQGGKFNFRKYKLFGKNNLSDSIWKEVNVDGNECRYFKVSVDLP